MAPFADLRLCPAATPPRPPTPAGEEVSAFLWDWPARAPSTSATPPSGPPGPAKNWALSLPRPPKAGRGGWGLRTLAGILLTNLASLLLGAGLGVWIYRRSRSAGNVLKSDVDVDECR